MEFALSTAPAAQWQGLCLQCCSCSPMARRSPSVLLLQPNGEAFAFTIALAAQWRGVRLHCFSCSPMARRSPSLLLLQPNGEAFAFTIALVAQWRGVRLHYFSCSPMARRSPSLLLLQPNGEAFAFSWQGVRLESGRRRVEPRVCLFVCFPFPRLSYTSDLEIGTPIATPPGARRFRVSARTGWPCVSILLLGETAS